MDADSPHATHPHAVDTEVFFEGRPSILLLLPTFAKALIPSLLAAAVWWVGDGHTPAVVLLVGVSCVVVLYGYVMWLSTSYRITNDRIEYERGILSKTVLNVELWRVRDVLYRRSILQFFLGLGVIDILATDDTIPKLEIGPIPNARGIYDKLKQARLKSGRLAGAQAMGMTS